MGYNDDATLALRLCGAVCLIRSCMYTIYPDTLTSIIGYPPAPAAAGSNGNVSNRDYESVVLDRMRRAQEKARLIAAMEAEDALAASVENGAS